MCVIVCLCRVGGESIVGIHKFDAVATKYCFGLKYLVSIKYRNIDILDNLNYHTDRFCQKEPQVFRLGHLPMTSKPPGLNNSANMEVTKTALLQMTALTDSSV